MNKITKIKLQAAAYKEFRNLTRADKELLVESLQTSHNYINQIIAGSKLIGPMRVQVVEKILKRPGLAARLRPDYFGALK